MKDLRMKLINYLILIITVFLFSCKGNNEDRGCPMFDIVLTSPYDNPVWHPSGEIIGFNHTPIKDVIFLRHGIRMGAK